MKKIKIGVLGLYRGSSMINYCLAADNAELVAICDKWIEGIELQKQKHPDSGIVYYTDFDEFLRHDMDIVVLANYANEHAPFAIKAMKAGKHVFSEVLPVQTMKEAVELVEAVEETGMLYGYAENYCYMAAPYEMRKLYREGKFGNFQYGEGEYIHNCESVWPSLAYGDKKHWRNNMYANYYCTHSLGPIIHITGLRPVSVVGTESLMNESKARVGNKGGLFGIEMVTLENGGIIKSIHGGLRKNSVWYAIYGTKGSAESAREITKCDANKRIYVNLDPDEATFGKGEISTYLPKRELDEQADKAGHGGSDFYSIWHFVEKVKGNPDADIIDIYEAMDMFLPGMFAYRSVLNGNKEMKIPNLRDKAVREQYRNDTMCTDPNVAGDMLLPTLSTGTPEIPDDVYAAQKKIWDDSLVSGNSYIDIVMSEGEGKEDKLSNNK
ncbi:MAG: Gfo/Idh/MocA family oxidoreductase [Clostridia bacterium]|nr:Gfo/Idh/MocA family oxidoreductase [Clostridia bacterium]